MNRRTLFLLIVAFMMSAAACSTPTDPVTMDSQAADAPEDLSIQADVIAPEVGGSDTPSPRDLPTEATAEVKNFDESSGCEPGNGCFMEPCESAADCAEGFCILHMGEKVCTRTCVEECPDGFQCEQSAQARPDVIFVCASKVPSLCYPCADDDQCQQLAGTGSSCVSYGEQGHFCGSVCYGEEDCPLDYECQQVGTIDGLLTAQCVHVLGVCECTSAAIAAGAVSQCDHENTDGICLGLRACEAGGLSPCDAPVPASEICDGADNNCDGEIDETDCDDANPCTADQCTGEGGCVNTPATGGECLDGDACTIGDHCDSGECVGTDLNCDDVNPCTDDTCDSELGCVYEFNGAACDDGNPCTFGDTCLADQCVGLPGLCECQKDGDCVDLAAENKCLGQWYCNKNETPFSCVLVPGTEVACEEPEGPDKHCVVNVCEMETGECVSQAANPGGPCDDGDLCTVSDQCSNGVCVAGSAQGCNDGNACTDDWCEPKIGCMNINNVGPCDDSDACTVGDACSSGECVSGQAADCDDGNVCTDDSCDPVAGCVHVANQGECDDLEPCTQGDICLNGWCVPGTLADCDDGNVCTDDSCAANGQCLNLPNIAACDDNDPCTVNDHCAGGSCQSGPVQTCDDGNVCTDDSCNDNGICLHVPNQAGCNDQNACTLNDHCEGGDCVFDSFDACDDDNVCTTDTCDSAVGCGYQLNDNPCDDGDSCTVADFCNLGECVSGQTMACDDKNSCTEDSCQEGIGCQFVPVQGECSDGNDCTDGDSCQDGVCVAGAGVACDDGNPCTVDSCDPLTGCKNEPVDLPCSDGDACTVGDACVDGQCVPGVEANCNDGDVCTDDSCDLGLGCLYVHNTAGCSDGDECTVGDACLDGACVPGGAADCDDSNVCTDDSCDPDSGCVNLPNTEACDDNDECSTGDVCKSSFCFGAGVLNCDDAKACTTDSCDAAQGCLHEPIAPCCSNLIVEPPEECDDGNLSGGDGCDAQCKEEAGVCSNGSSVDCNPSGTTLHAGARFVDPNPPNGWTQCGGFVNTNGDDVTSKFLDNCLNTTRMRVRAWNVNSGQLEEDVYVDNMSSWSQWPDWNYLGGSMHKLKSTYWTGGTTYFSTYNGQDACNSGCCNAGPAGSMTLGTGNGSSVIFAPGNTNALEWRVSCGGQALGNRKVAVYR